MHVSIEEVLNEYKAVVVRLKHDAIPIVQGAKNKFRFRTRIISPHVERPGTDIPRQASSLSDRSEKPDFDA
jgi:hypothetical protein